MFTSVLVTILMFECSGPYSIFTFNVALRSRRLFTPGLIISCPINHNVVVLFVTVFIKIA